MGNCSLKAVTDATEGSKKVGHDVEVLSTPRGAGVWKVKMVIHPKDLEKIIAEEVNIEALIEQMRTVAAAAANSTPKRGKSNGTNLSLMCS